MCIICILIGILVVITSPIWCPCVFLGIIFEKCNCELPKNEISEKERDEKKWKKAQKKRERKKAEKRNAEASHQKAMAFYVEKNQF